MTSSHWLPFAQVEALAPRELQSWLAEPGLLTARIRALCGERMQFRMLGPLREATLEQGLRTRLAVADEHCLLRDIEFSCDGERIVFAQTVLPASTVAEFPWLCDLGDSPIGESLRRADSPVDREPLEYAELLDDDPLARAARTAPDQASPLRARAGDKLWARRAVYRLGGRPILVQEVFLPALLQVRVL